ncbi:MAG: hypothetical protein QM660_08830 [Dysgonomonas sp.]
MAEVDKTVVETPEGSADITQVETPRGRAGVLAKYQKTNPDAEGDPSEEDLWDFAGKGYDDVKGKYNEMNGANVKLAELVSQNPQLGAFLSKIVGEESKSVPFALGEVFGKDWMDADPEEFEKGYQENLARLAESASEQEQAAKNIQEYKANLEKFKAENELDDTQIAELNSAIYDDAENILNGIIPMEYIEYKWKGLNYDKDVQEAADTGFVEGKNEVVSAKMQAKTADSPIPDMSDGTGAGRSKQVNPQSSNNFFGGFPGKR